MLMQAAHPLVIAGANQTGMYERNPWTRLQRTLVLQYALTFGTKGEAHAAADRINAVHERINGVDTVTGLRYDALVPELLLWVHACLVESALLFERFTVGKLDAAGRQRFHEEQMLAAELLRLPRERIPATVPALEAYIADTIRSGELLVTDAARSVAGLFVHPPRDAQWRPVLRAVARLAFGTLPLEVREGYGFPSRLGGRTQTRAMCTAIRAIRPLLPPKYRFIAPYQVWRSRQGGRAGGSGLEAARRSLGSACDGTLLTVAIEGLLLDIDGVLAVSWEALPGAVDAMQRLREDRIPFRLITNTTTKTRAGLAGTLRDAGFDVREEEIVTAVVATTANLRAAHPGAKVFVLSDGDATEDLAGIELVGVQDADVIVIGGACEDFTYETMNEIFRRLMDGATLVGMHRNLFWKTSEGWELDGGAYIAGLEEAADTKATICGKPEKAYFDAALAMLGLEADRVAMVGDDMVNDILGAQAAGLTGILVRTGKYRGGDEIDPDGRPDHILASFADVPGFLGSS